MPDSSGASPTCRCDLAASRLLAGCLMLAGGLCVVAVMRSALNFPLALAVAGLALVWSCWLAWREGRRRPQTLLLRALGEDATLIEDEEETPVTLQSVRFRGPFVLLAWRDVAQRCVRRTLWPDALPESQRRALRRRFGHGGESTLAGLGG